MRLRIVSDLHLNKNGDDKPTFDINDDVLTIIAGDVSKNIDETYEYIHSNFKRAIFVEGNHLLYKNDNIPIQDKYDELRKMFPIESDLTFLQNNYKIVGDYIFIGATLWTNFSVGDCDLETAFERCRLYMGETDIKNGVYRDKNGEIKKFCPEFWLDEFNKSINYINEILEKFKDKKAIIITHYSISEKVITKEFVNHIFNTTFTSKNEDIFKSFENIVLFIHGHCHTHLEYKINGIPVVCNAFGMSPIEKAKYVHNFTVEI